MGIVTGRFIEEGMGWTMRGTKIVPETGSLDQTEHFTEQLLFAWNAVVLQEQISDVSKNFFKIKN